MDKNDSSRKIKSFHPHWSIFLALFDKIFRYSYKTSFHKTSSPSKRPSYKTSFHKKSFHKTSRLQNIHGYKTSSDTKHPCLQNVLAYKTSTDTKRPQIQKFRAYKTSSPIKRPPHKMSSYGGGGWSKVGFWPMGPNPTFNCPPLPLIHNLFIFSWPNSSASF